LRSPRAHDPHLYVGIENTIQQMRTSTWGSDRVVALFRGPNGRRFTIAAVSNRKADLAGAEEMNREQLPKIHYCFWDWRRCKKIKQLTHRLCSTIFNRVFLSIQLTSQKARSLRPASQFGGSSPRFGPSKWAEVGPHYIMASSSLRGNAGACCWFLICDYVLLQVERSGHHGFCDKIRGMIVFQFGKIKWIDKPHAPWIQNPWALMWITFVAGHRIKLMVSPVE
jgi:hypothetical protein